MITNLFRQQLQSVSAFQRMENILPLNIWLRP
jgi:hypothetical protein